MIDTMFFLLVFFMLSSLALTRLNGLPVNLPGAHSAQKQAPARLTISLDKNGKVFVNKTETSLARLQQSLRQGAGTADIGTSTLVLNADARVPHGLVVRCMDEARSMGFVRFAIATKVEPSAP